MPKELLNIKLHYKNQCFDKVRGLASFHMNINDKDVLLNFFYDYTSVLVWEAIQPFTFV